MHFQPDPYESGWDKKTTNLDTWRMMSKCGDARGTNKHGDDYEPRMVTLDTLQWSSCQISETSDLSGVILRNFKSIRPPKRPPKKQEQRVATPWRWRLNKPKFKKKKGEGLDGGSWSFSKYLKSSHIRLSECIPNKTSTICAAEIPGFVDQIWLHHHFYQCLLLKN